MHDESSSAPATPVPSPAEVTTSAAQEGGVSPAPAPVSAAAAPGAADPCPRCQSLEALALQALREHRASRRWRVFFRLSWLVLGAFMVWLTTREVPDLGLADGHGQAHTALVELQGEIAADSQASAATLLPALRAAFEEPQAQAVILLINSPGGSPVQAGILHDEIVRLKQLHNKPLYAVVEETCASAAYYVAVAADNIYVDKASMVGSIGVLMDGFGFTGLMNKLGVERRLLTAGANKGFLDPFSPVTPRQQAQGQQMLNDIHAQFIQVVREGRGQRLKDSPDLFSGLVWTGQRAVGLGLADDLGSLDQVAREVVGAEQVIDYTVREGVAERLVQRLGAGMGEAALHMLQPKAGSLR